MENKLGELREREREMAFKSKREIERERAKGNVSDTGADLGIIGFNFDSVKQPVERDEQIG